MNLLATATTCVFSLTALAIEPANPKIEEIALKEGIQPQIAVSQDGTLHQLYYKGDAKAGDLFYVTRSSGVTNWSTPIRVNSRPGSAVAIGNDRGGQIALGRNGFVHVAWNGSAQIPVGSEKTSPMLYARLPPGAKAFEPERNLMMRSSELDGGGSVAANSKGNVFVVWHGHPMDSATKGEVARRVFVATSADDGATFTAEAPLNDPGAGVCGCCGLKAQCLSGDDLLILYRGATQSTHRDMRLMRSMNAGKSFTDVKLDDWERNGCPMSTASIASFGNDAALAWETDGTIRWCIAAPDVKAPAIYTLGQKSDGCKYPSIATDNAGHIVIAWTQGMRWESGGTLNWALINARDGSTLSTAGSGLKVPAWSLVSVAAQPDAKFAIFH